MRTTSNDSRVDHLAQAQRDADAADGPVPSREPGRPDENLGYVTHPRDARGWDGRDPSRGAPGPKPGRRRRRAIWAGVLVLLLALAGGAVAVVLSAQPEPEPAVPPPPVILPVPTPTVQAVEREKATAFQQALPDEVLAFAVASQSQDDALLDAGALEAYRLTYTDGEVIVTLRAAQWETPAEASAAMTELAGRAAPSLPTGDSQADGGTTPPGETNGQAEPGAAASEPETTVREDDVLVGGFEVGRVEILGTVDAARAVWTNGSTLFEIVGPGRVVTALYDAFPM